MFHRNLKYTVSLHFLLAVTFVFSMALLAEEAIRLDTYPLRGKKLESSDELRKSAELKRKQFESLKIQMEEVGSESDKLARQIQEIEHSENVEIDLVRAYIAVSAIEHELAMLRDKHFLEDADSIRASTTVGDPLFKSMSKEQKETLRRMQFLSKFDNAYFKVGLGLSALAVPGLPLVEYFQRYSLTTKKVVWMRVGLAGAAVYSVVGGTYYKDIGKSTHILNRHHVYGNFEDALGSADKETIIDACLVRHSFVMKVLDWNSPEEGPKAFLKAFSERLKDMSVDQLDAIMNSPKEKKLSIRDSIEDPLGLTDPARIMILKILEEEYLVSKSQIEGLRQFMLLMQDDYKTSTSRSVEYGAEESTRTVKQSEVLKLKEAVLRHLETRVLTEIAKEEKPSLLLDRAIQMKRKLKEEIAAMKGPDFDIN